MNILGIVAEFNPLHTGHEYLIRNLRRETGAEFCVVVMSGDYVQRGEPAFFSKFLRTKAALLSGADLVLELPLSVSTGSAEYFAEGAVSLLAHLGCVTHLGFGSESGDIDAFRLAGKLLLEEPESFRRKLQENLRAGKNFPMARYEALTELEREYAAEASSHDGVGLSLCTPLLTDPNNILGVEYCKALHRLQSSILPVTLKRLGAGYHETLSGANAENPPTQYASASGLRKAFLSSCNTSSADSEEITTLLQNYVPTSCRTLYLGALRARQYVTFDQFFLPLYHILRYSDVKTLCHYQDVTGDFAERLLRLFGDCSSVTELCDAMKAKNLTSSGISRALLHILLRLPKETVRAEREKGLALYARILGFREESKTLLSEIDRCGDIPLVSKSADARRLLSPLAFARFELTGKASEIYRAAMPGAKPKSEYAQRIVVL